jgi:large subunit ribosomal protein L3
MVRQLSTTPGKKTRKALQSRTGVLAVKKSKVQESCFDGRGMSAVWDSAGKRNAVTVLQIPQAQVIAHKLMDKNGYWANQIGIGYRPPKNLSKAMLGHFAVAKVPPKAKVAEFRVKDEMGLLPLGTFCHSFHANDLGTEILASHFTEGQYVDVKGIGYNATRSELKF